MKAGLAIEDKARGRGRGNVRSAISAEHKSPGQDVPCESASTEVERAVRLWRTKSEPLVSVPAPTLGDGRVESARMGGGCEPHWRALGKDAPT